MHTCVYMLTEHAGPHTDVSACGGHRSILGVFLSHSSFLLETVTCFYLNFTKQGRQNDQKGSQGYAHLRSPGLTLSEHHYVWLPFFFNGFIFIYVYVVSVYVDLYTAQCLQKP